MLFIEDPFKFSDKCLSFKLELVDEFPKIVLSAINFQNSQNKPTLHQQATPDDGLWRVRKHLRQAVLIRLIQFSISTDFVYTQLNVKTVLYSTIQFSVINFDIIRWLSK